MREKKKDQAWKLFLAGLKPPQIAEQIHSTPNSVKVMLSLRRKEERSKSAHMPGSPRWWIDRGH